jgi:hypothetical protein
MMGAYMTGKNLYLSSLVNPEKVVAKIPDYNMWDSTTFQQVSDGVLTTAADGSCSIAVYPTCISPTAPTYAGILGTSAAAGAWGNWTTETAIVPSTSAAILAAFSQSRPVSGVLEIEFIGSTSTDQGQICGVPNFRGEAFPSTFANALRDQMSVAAPLRNGLRMLWRPMDPNDICYEPVNAGEVTGIAQPGGVAGPSALPYTSGQGIAIGTDQPRVALAAFISGATASTAVARFRWLVNYEAVPETSGLDLFLTTPSESNRGYIDAAFNTVSQLPWATVWQKAGGLVDALARETLSAQMPNIAQGLTTLGMGALGYGSRRSRGALTYDYPID